MQCTEAQYPANGGMVKVVEHMTTHKKKKSLTMPAKKRGESKRMV